MRMSARPSRPALPPWSPLLLMMLQMHSAFALICASCRAQVYPLQTSSLGPNSRIPPARSSEWSPLLQASYAIRSAARRVEALSCSLGGDRRSRDGEDYGTSFDEQVGSTRNMREQHRLQPEAEAQAWTKSRAEVPLNTGPRRSRRAEALRQRKGRAIVELSDAGTLLVSIPPRPFGVDTVFTGAFSVAWFSAIGTATLRSIGAGIAPLLFTAPFWAAGALVVKTGVIDNATEASISVGRFAWEYRTVLAGFTVRELTGSTEELRGASAEIAMYVNGVPVPELRLYTADGEVGLALAVSPEECDSIAAEINAALDRFDEAE